MQEATVSSPDGIDEESVNAETTADEETIASEMSSDTQPDESDVGPYAVQSLEERKAIIEALIYVSDEPLSAKSIAAVLKDDQQVDRKSVV